MPQTMSLMDRIRVERTVSLVDSYLSDLPRKSRVAKRRELRANLRDATADVGSAEALRRLGSPRKLAAQYVAAEYGDWELRPSWMTGILCGALTLVGATALVQISISSFSDGVLAGAPHTQGAVHWQGIPYVTSPVDFTFADGKSSSLGGAWTPLVYLCIVAACVLGGRLWRLLPVMRRRNADVGAEPRAGGDSVEPFCRLCGETTSSSLVTTSLDRPLGQAYTPLN